MTPNPPFGEGDVYLLKDFVENVKIGLFNEFDGSGYWATETHYDIESPFDFEKPKRPIWATHVVWFNK